MKNRILYPLLIIVIISLWELFGRNNSIKILVSTPSLSYSYLVTNYSALLQATSVTFIEALLGLIIAVGFSFSVMIICLYFPRLFEFVLPAMITSQVIPLITLAPLFIVLLGIGIQSKIAMAALMCFFPVFVNFAAGIKTIPQNILDLMKIYNASTTFKIFNIYFPLSIPSIFSGLKISSTLSVIGSIVAEFNGADIGLGKNLFLAAKRLEPELMINSLILSGLLGGLMYFIIYLIEMKVGKWYLKNKVL